MDKDNHVAVRIVGGKTCDWGNAILLLYDWTSHMDYLQGSSNEVGNGELVG